MNNFVACPHCRVTVIPMDDNSCPSCQKNLNDKAEIKKSINKHEWEEHIYWGLRQKVKLQKLIDELHEKGYDRSEVSNYAQERLKKVKLKRSDVWMMWVFPGIAMAGFGLVIRIFFFIAELSRVSWMCWGSYGMMLIGCILAIEGFFLLRKIV